MSRSRPRRTASRRSICLIDCEEERTDAPGGACRDVEGEREGTLGLGPVNGDAASWLHCVLVLLKSRAHFGSIDRVREDVGPRRRLRHFGVERPVFTIRSWVVHFGVHRSHRTGTRLPQQLRGFIDCQEDRTLRAVLVGMLRDGPIDGQWLSGSPGPVSDEKLGSSAPDRCAKTQKQIAVAQLR